MKKVFYLIVVCLLAVLIVPSYAASTEFSEKYEAGEAELSGGANLNVGNVNSLDGDHVDAEAAFRVEVPESGIYGLRVYYSTPAPAATLSVFVDDAAEKSAVVRFAPHFKSWEAYEDDQFASAAISLNAGENVIRLRRTAEDSDYVAVGAILVENTYNAYLYGKNAELSGGSNLNGDNVNSLDGDHIGAAASWKTYIPISGKYTVRVYYFTSIDVASLSLTIDQAQKTKVVFDHAASGGNWGQLSYDCFSEFTLDLQEGEHTICLTRSAEDEGFVAVGAVSFSASFEVQKDPEPVPDPKPDPEPVPNPPEPQPETGSEQLLLPAVCGMLCLCCLRISGKKTKIKL